MAIIRSKRESNFTLIGNAGLKDKRLSLKAKGLLAYMLSLPDDWTFYETELSKHCTDGRDSIRSALKELERAGYLVRMQKRGERGKFSEKDWKVFDTPLTGFPSTGNPTTDKPSTDNPTLLSTNSTKTNNTKTNNKNILSSSNEQDHIPYKEIIDYLNEKANKAYKSNGQKTKSLIKARWQEGFQLTDFKKVIDNKCFSWNTGEMNKFLRPQTLFGTKFEGYLNENNQGKQSDFFNTGVRATESNLTSEERKLKEQIGF